MKRGRHSTSGMKSNKSCDQSQAGLFLKGRQMEEANRCRCGHTPDIYIRIRLQEPKYQGVVECPECGESVCGIQWHWSKDPAAEDATEEWNKVMPEEVEDDR